MAERMLLLVFHCRHLPRPYLCVLASQQAASDALHVQPRRHRGSQHALQRERRLAPQRTQSLASADLVPLDEAGELGRDGDRHRLLQRLAAVEGGDVEVGYQAFGAHAGDVAAQGG